MKADLGIDASTKVSQVMRDWPCTVRVFLDHGMLCVGCSAARFHSLSKACLDHGIPEKAFLKELTIAVEAAA